MVFFAGTGVKNSLPALGAELHAPSNSGVLQEKRASPAYIDTTDAASFGQRRRRETATQEPKPGKRQGTEKARKHPGGNP